MPHLPWRVVKYVAVSHCVILSYLTLLLFLGDYSGHTLTQLSTIKIGQPSCTSERYLMGPSFLVSHMYSRCVFVCPCVCVCVSMWCVSVCVCVCVCPCVCVCGGWLSATTLTECIVVSNSYFHTTWQVLIAGWVVWQNLADQCIPCENK